MTTIALFKPTPNVAPKKSNKLGRPTDYASVAERVNGRAAMVGFTSVLVDQVVTGHTISAQFQEHAGLAVAVSALTFLGTAVNAKDEGVIQGPFEPEAELINGRLAMVGVLSLALMELPLF